jgi:predicted nucleotidyltransferase
LIDLRDKDDLRALGDIVRDLRDHSAGADFMLVGATARDLWLQYHHGVEPLRKTTDVDFAFAVSDWAAYIALTKRLIETGCFKPDERAQHRLRNRIGTVVDILPFGGVESPEAQIVWPPPDETLMSVIGYAEASAATETIMLPGTVPLAVITVPMLALLKLFAWEDRHWAQPRKDAGDLLFVLDHAFRMAGLERLHDIAPELFDLDDFDSDLAGAWLIGYQARRVVDQHSQRAQAIITRASTIIARETDPNGPLSLIGEVEARNPERARRTLGAFGHGLTRVRAL